jgi:hypothetical protein
MKTIRAVSGWANVAKANYARDLGYCHAWTTNKTDGKFSRRPVSPPRSARKCTRFFLPANNASLELPTANPRSRLVFGSQGRESQLEQLRTVRDAGRRNWTSPRRCGTVSGRERKCYEASHSVRRESVIGTSDLPSRCTAGDSASH